MPESRFARCEDLVTWSRIRMQASLRWHLTYWLIGPLLLLVTAGNFVSYPIPPHPAAQAHHSPPLRPGPSVAQHPPRPAGPPHPHPPPHSVQNAALAHPPPSFQH